MDPAHPPRDGARQHPFQRHRAWPARHLAHAARSAAAASRAARRVASGPPAVGAGQRVPPHRRRARPRAGDHGDRGMGGAVAVRRTAPGRGRPDHTHVVAPPTRRYHSIANPACRRRVRLHRCRRHDAVAGARPGRAVSVREGSGPRRRSRRRHRPGLDDARLSRESRPWPRRSPTTRSSSSVRRSSPRRSAAGSSGARSRPPSGPPSATTNAPWSRRVATDATQSNTSAGSPFSCARSGRCAAPVPSVRKYSTRGWSSSSTGPGPTNARSSSGPAE